MNRRMNSPVGFLLAAAALAFGQEPTPAPPQTPEDAFAAQQLVVWSRLQEPQPAPQPLPPRDAPVPQPDQPGKQSPDRHSPPDQAPTARSFTGKIVKDGGKYVLKVASNTTYELQIQGEVGSFENQTVKVIGNLDTGSNTIRVVKIELLS